MIRRTFFGALFGAPFAARAAVEAVTSPGNTPAPEPVWGLGMKRLTRVNPIKRAVYRHGDDIASDKYAMRAPADELPFSIREKRSWSTAFKGHVYCQELRKQRTESRKFENMTIDERVQYLLDKGVELEKYIMRSDREDQDEEYYS